MAARGARPQLSGLFARTMRRQRVIGVATSSPALVWAGEAPRPTPVFFSFFRERLIYKRSCPFRCAPRAAHWERLLLLPISLFKFAYFLLDTRKFVSPCLRKRLVFLLPRLKLVHQLEQFGPALV